MKTILRDLAFQAKAWPIEEARKLLERVQDKVPQKGYVLFETGYGPSGLPHLGTFGEVARTLMVKYAFSLISDIPTKLFVFSDDMDGLRKIPDNMPNVDMLKEHLGKPLTSIPDPYERYGSYGEYMNNKLKEFLNQFHFEYEFYSATDFYKSGRLDDALKAILTNYDAIMNIMLPTLGDERQSTYSPFLPICPKTGVVLQVPVTGRNLETNEITYKDEQGNDVTVSILKGACKLQWKVDWAMRWFTLDVDYEMFGKDLIASAEVATQILEVVKHKPPQLFQYEHFLDAAGAKISKSKGNGMTIDDWLKYAPASSLMYYLYQSPRRAKRIDTSIIPKQVDDYLTYLNKYPLEDQAQQLENPVNYIHFGDPSAGMISLLNYSMLLNMAIACDATNSALLWKFISRYDSTVTKENDPVLSAIVDRVINYYNDCCKDNKKYKIPTRQDIDLLKDLIVMLRGLHYKASPAEIQSKLFDLAAANNFTDTKEFFKNFYLLFFGAESGPRLGSFISIYGLDNTIAFINKIIAKDVGG